MPDSASPNSIRNLLGKEISDSIRPATLNVGSVFKIILCEADGLILADGHLSRNKHVIVVGQEGDNVGIVLINTKVVRMNDPLLKASKYPHILDYDSYVSTKMICSVNKERLLSSEFEGNIDLEDSIIVLQCLENTIKPKQLNSLGIPEEIKRLQELDDTYNY